MSTKKSKDLLGKLMGKIVKGKKLTKRERELLSVAIDASKKAKSEGRRGVKEGERGEKCQKSKKQQTEWWCMLVSGGKGITGHHQR